MKNPNICSLLFALITLGVAGCQSPAKIESPAQPSVVPAAPAFPAAAESATTPVSAPTAAMDATAMPSRDGVIRINAGASASVKDSAGNVWWPDQGFTGGDVVERPEVVITNVPNGIIYQSEHYGMDSFSWKLPNGKYKVNLYFAETYDGITGPGDRVFSFNVQGREFKDFDVWKAAGAAQKPVEITADATVTDGQLLIKFTANVENPQINGIEIIPDNTP
jgi:hypothetical protein